jgi:hypothetical protein
MEVSRIENIPPPPGVISSIKAGFDTVASHVTAILLPLLLNLFLWLGPQLRVNDLFDSVMDNMVVFWQTGGITPADIERMMDTYNKSIPVFNLFWLLRAIPIGVSTPLGDSAIWQVSAISLFGWVFLLTLAGWVAGGLYFRSISWLATANKDEEPVSVSRAIIQTILISIFWAILMIVVALPIMMVLALIAQLNPFIANLILLFMSLASMWVIVPLFFWPHGVFIKKQNVITSIISSVQMARFTLPTSSMFVLTVFLLSFGLNFLWSIPPKSSWMTIVGILGHSFVTTALLAGSFIYYRDMNIWLQNVIEKLRPNTVTKQA